jgi:hypothetical protein
MKGQTQVTLTIDYAAINRIGYSPGEMVDVHIFSLAQSIAAVAKGLAPRKTGKLADSIKTERIGPSTWTVKADTEYALPVERGAKPHVITPKSAGVLRFPSKSGTIVYTQRVNHPGNAPNPFMEQAMIAVLGKS